MLPAKLGAKEEEDKPSLMIAIGKVKPKTPKALGSDEYAEDEGEAEDLDPKRAMEDATREIIACLGGSPSALKRLNAALEAHHRAVDIMIEREEAEGEEEKLEEEEPEEQESETE